MNYDAKIIIIFNIQKFAAGKLFENLPTGPKPVVRPIH